MTTIPYARQNINEADIQAVVEVLYSGRITQGSAVEEFEKAVARYSGAKYAVAVNSATSALHLACLASKLGSGDLLWTSPNTFVATANSAIYCGASVDFIDIDLKTYNLSMTALEAKLVNAKQRGKLPKVVIPVHFAGHACDLQKIADLADEYGFTVIEDAAHAIGGSYQNQKIGSGKYSKMTVFSFHPAKLMTTGEGGMILTNHQPLYEKLIRLRSHGITRDPSLMEDSPDGSWYYQQIELGYNYRMTDIQAALGNSQLGRLDEFLIRRQKLIERYNQRLSALPLVLPEQEPEVVSANHLYVVRLRLSEIKKTRKEVFEALRNSGIEVNVHYIPVHTQPFYRKLGFKLGDFPKTERYYSEALTLPLYYDLTFEEQDYVIASLTEILK